MCYANLSLDYKSDLQCSHTNDLLLSTCNLCICDGDDYIFEHKTVRQGCVNCESCPDHKDVHCTLQIPSKFQN